MTRICSGEGAKALLGWIALTLLLACPPSARAQWFGTPGTGPSGEIITIKASDGSALKVRVLKPAGSPPFPLAVVSHGSPASASQRPTMTVPLLKPISDWLLARGYMVALPLRRGYGESGGDWAEGYGPCKNPDYYHAGLRGGSDILDVVGHLRATRTVKPDRLLLVGWSAGGWASLAAGSTNPTGLLAIVNFAGGRGGGQDGGNCTPSRLVEAAGRFGGSTKVPTLWLYSENDQFFEPALAKQMFDAFVKAGGRGTFSALPAFRADGHQAFPDERGRPLWEPAADSFLRKF